MRSSPRSTSSTNTVSAKPSSAAIGWRAASGTCEAVEKHAERVAAAAVGRAEHPQDVKLGRAAGPPSVAEVATAGEDHRDARLVAGGDHLVVALRAARLDRPRSRRRPIAACGPSAKGKNASEATDRSGRARPRPVRRTRRRAFSTAIRTESTRLICPAPIPTVAPSFANTIAFERTWRHTFQANIRSSPLLLASGLAFVGHGSSSSRDLVDPVRVLGQQAAADPLQVALPRLVALARSPRGSGSPPSASAPRARPSS